MMRGTGVRCGGLSGGAVMCGGAKEANDGWWSAG
jgi:hypothetical protein